MFLKGTDSFGKNWKRIASLIPNRSVVQIRTHAQKHFQKMEKLNKLEKDSSHSQGSTHGRQVRADTMTDVIDSNRCFKVNVFDGSDRTAPKKVRAMTLGSAELSIGSAINKNAAGDRNLMGSEDEQYLYSNCNAHGTITPGDNNLNGCVYIHPNGADVIPSPRSRSGSGSLRLSPAHLTNSLHADSASEGSGNGRGRANSSTSKRNVADMQDGLQQYAAINGPFSPLGTVGEYSPGFSCGSVGSAGLAPGAGALSGSSKSPGRKTRVYRSKSFEELESKGSGGYGNGKISPPTAAAVGGLCMSSGSSGTKMTKGSPRGPRKTGMKRSQSMQSAVSAEAVAAVVSVAPLGPQGYRDHYFAEYSPTSVLGSTMIGHGWLHESRLQHNNGTAGIKGVTVAGGRTTATIGHGTGADFHNGHGNAAADDHTLPSLFPDFDDLVRSMEVEDQGHQLQYVQYQYPDMPPLGSMQEDVEYDDLTQSCKEMWGAGNGTLVADHTHMLQSLCGFSSISSKTGYGYNNNNSNSSNGGDVPSTSYSSTRSPCSGDGRDSDSDNGGDGDGNEMLQNTNHNLDTNCGFTSCNPNANSSGMNTTSMNFEDGCLTDGFVELLY